MVVRTPPRLTGLLGLLLLANVVRVVAQAGLPSYHYGAPIHVECMNRSS